MTDELALHQKTSRAARARALIEDELLVEAFAKLDADYVQAWRATDARDDDARQRLWQAANILGIVKDHLRKMIIDGKIAQKDLDLLTEKRRRTGAA